MGQGQGLDQDNPRFSIWKYTPPGQVAQAYIVSQGPIDLIRGPWGSGKTVATVFKVTRHVAVDFAVCRDGWVHARAAAIRATYREMAKTALASWHEFFPRNGPFTRRPILENYQGGIDRPVKHILEWKVVRRWYKARGQWEERETPVRLEMEFGAIGSQNLDSFFKGYEISIGWGNECDLLEESVMGRLYGRTGRYPPQSEIMPWEAERLGVHVDPDTGVEAIRQPRIVCGDFNPPDEANWTYQREIEEPEKWPTYNFFAQPSGLSSRAENRAGKSRMKYEEEEKAFGGPKSPDSRRNVHGEYAAKADGAPIYAGDFALEKHRAGEPLQPVRELPLLLGMDAGGTPAAVILQPMPSGQMRYLRELTTDPKTITGPVRFAQALMHLLLQEFSGMAVTAAYGDPAAQYGADTQAGDRSWMETVSAILSVNIRPTWTNELGARIEALRLQMRDIDATTPGLLIDPRCTWTLRGLVSQYKATKNSTEGKTGTLIIDKNQYSHVVEAGQYAVLGYRGAGMASQAAAAVRGPNVSSLSQARRAPARSIWDL